MKDENIDINLFTVEEEDEEEEEDLRAIIKRKEYQIMFLEFLMTSHKLLFDYKCNVLEKDLQYCLDMYPSLKDLIPSKILNV